ncbi:pilus assembly protein PilM [Halomonas binhaiensis]|uniref:Pilus assembly protein PilM n=1 Tax=Halomonas binhaiensis TaxID=2562282 RepID=A0A5C1NAD1_9GAMM|nr:pilus assembly protein PilM [Halomonas binhaiensis]QEM80672.1 pilus assembly protein PilM [Halomonas binhaiensis]
MIWPTSFRARLGVDISPDAIRFMELAPRWPGWRPRASRFVVRDYAVMPLPEGCIVEGRIRQSSALIALLRKGVERFAPRSLRVITALPSSTTSSNVMYCPAHLNGDGIAAFIEWNSDTQLPFPFPESAYDFYCLDARPENGRQEVLLVACHRQFIEQLAEVLECAGLQVAAIDAEGPLMRRVEEVLYKAGKEEDRAALGELLSFSPGLDGNALLAESAAWMRAFGLALGGSGINLLPWRDVDRTKRTRRFWIGLVAMTMLSVGIGMAVSHELEQRLARLTEAEHAMSPQSGAGSPERLASPEEERFLQQRIAALQELLSQLQLRRATSVAIFNALAASLVPGVRYQVCQRQGDHLELAGMAQNNTQLMEQLRLLGQQPLFTKVALTSVTDTEGQQHFSLAIHLFPESLNGGQGG